MRECIHLEESLRLILSLACVYVCMHICVSLAFSFSGLSIILRIHTLTPLIYFVCTVSAGSHIDTVAS